MRTLPSLLPLLAVLATGCLGKLPEPPPTHAPGSTLGLPPLEAPPGNPLTTSKIDLGRKLFMDRRLSPNNTMSCAMCHVPEQGFTSNELATGLGMEGKSLRRNAPTVLNVAFVQQLFHDGRESGLETQAWGPLLASNEMGNPSISYVLDKIKAMPDYAGRFEAAFNGRGPGMETVGAAIASYQRSLLAGGAPFDLWREGKEPNALNRAAQAGYKVFAGKGRCILCHTVGERSALFSDGRFHNTGIGWARTMGVEAGAGAGVEAGSEAVTAKTTHKVQLAPGVEIEVADALLAPTSEPLLPDVGRYEITGIDADRWAYRTPSLRNLALTAPYMHDGSLATLEEVIKFYQRGGIDNPNKDPLLRPLSLSAREQADLVAFLRSLTSPNAKALAEQARSGAGQQ